MTVKLSIEKLAHQISISAHNAADFVILAKEAQTPVEKSAAVATQIGAGVALVGGLSQAEWAIVGVIFGIVIGVASFGFNVYVSLRRLRNEERAAHKGALKR